MRRERWKKDGRKDMEIQPMNLIIAGANPLATDMVAASVMGFEPEEIPTFVWAQKAGMLPHNLDEVEVRGEKISNVRRIFKKPALVTWNEIRSSWGVQEMA